METPVWTEKRKSGHVGFPLSRETPGMDLEVVKSVFEKNGYEVGIEYAVDGIMFVIGIKE
jgi:hypothetical protein